MLQFERVVVKDFLECCGVAVILSCDVHITNTVRMLIDNGN